MKGKINFDYNSLKDFLRSPKTASQVQKKFNFKRRNDMTNVITNATYRMPIYEIKIKNTVVYGLMEGVK